MTSDPAATYRSLAAYTMQLAPKKLRYLAPGNTDPTQSGIDCNLSGSSCGNRMPLVTNGAQTLDAQQVRLIDTWVRCGSPEN
jgi:hypothetical protein